MTERLCPGCRKSGVCLIEDLRVFNLAASDALIFKQRQKPEWARCTRLDTFDKTDTSQMQTQILPDPVAPPPPQADAPRFEIAAYVRKSAKNGNQPVAETSSLQPQYAFDNEYAEELLTEIQNTNFKDKDKIIQVTRKALKQRLSMPVELTKEQWKDFLVGYLQKLLNENNFSLFQSGIVLSVLRNMVYQAQELGLRHSLPTEEPPKNKGYYNGKY